MLVGGRRAVRVASQPSRIVARSVAAAVIGLADAAAVGLAIATGASANAAVGLASAAPAIAAAVGLAVAAAGMRVERWHGIALRRKLHPSIAENLVFLLQWQRGGLYQCIHTPHDR